MNQIPEDVRRELAGEFMVDAQDVTLGSKADAYRLAARALTGEYEADVLRKWADRFMEERGDVHGIVTWFHLQASAIEARIKGGENG